MAAAVVMPWPHRLAVAMVEREMENDRRILSCEEGEALWAVFDKDLDRLFDATAAAEDAAEAAALAAQGITSIPT